MLRLVKSPTYFPSLLPIQERLQERFMSNMQACAKVVGRTMKDFKLGVAVLLLVLVMQHFNSVAARPYQPPPSGRHLLAEVSDYQSFGETITVEMLHRDHVHSPLRKSGAQNQTFADRLMNAVSRSSHRTQSIRHKIKMLAYEANSSTYRRNVQLLGVTTTLFSQEGEYIVNIALGSPPKNMTAILDSGSDMVWVQCAPCPNCISQPDLFFDTTKSTSYSTLPCLNSLCKALPRPTIACSGNTCPYQYEYGDGTISSGQFSTDKITLGSITGGFKSIRNFAFGCGTDNSGDLAGADGIVGIGRGIFSLPSQLGELLGNKFSFCLVNMDLASTTTSPLAIGNDSFVSAAGASWTPLVINTHNPTFYYVQVNAIKLDGKVLPGIPASTFGINSHGIGGTILDTGTTITELLPAAYDVLLTYLRKLVKFPETDASQYGFDICWDTSGAPSSGPVFPVISFQLNWTEFPLRSDSAYLDVNLNVQCLSFSSGEGFNIIGNVHLQNVYMFFNNDDMVVGFKPAQCDQVQ